MKICSKICKECPFSNKSMPGWLGPHSIEEILDSQQFEHPFSCHMQRTEDSSISDILTGELQICRGWVASATKSCKKFGQNPLYPGLSELQNQIKPEELEGVLARWEFRKYHE